MKPTKGEKIGRFLISIFLGLFVFTTIYPFWHVLMYSISDSKLAITGGFFFWPKGFSLAAYEVVFKTQQVWVAYRNSIMVTMIGTIFSVVLSALTAYPLSRRYLPGRRTLGMIFFFTMLFSGGMIPLYLQVSSLGLIDKFLALFLPTSLSVYNMFILRNFMQGIPDSLEESARLDGANDLTILFRIMVPLSTPSLAAIAMFYGVAYWNNYMNCLLYTNNNRLQVLPLFLRSVMAMDSSNAIAAANDTALSAVTGQTLTEESIKMTVVAVSVIPVLLVYPYLQRYYTKGITVGAIKE
ncbi:MAG: carbohydrate ABC transporter permease [Clostridiales bacterium]|nr:carbohydrate ABC transporter permease [Clostridiales bacterium]